MRLGWPAVLAVMVIALGGSRPALGLRPFVSTDAEVAAPGELEFELGYVGFNRRAGTTAVVAPVLRANLGIVWDLEVVAEFEAAHTVSSGGRPRCVAWGVIVESPLVRDVRAVAELNGQGVRGNTAESSALVGALWVLEPPPPLTTLTLDAGVRRGISRGADDWAGTAGLTVGFPW
ncbi:MAG: hypothetical protein E6J83_06790 [Deltaproteobacteria bacterium]|nr:MAG: hypothetical protein E6J83_06790 [Deltaproteobacteria bacterium]